MDKQNIEQKAFEYYHSGFHCAEAVLKAIAGLYGEEHQSEITKFASGFGGGIGGSNCEACGALTGGIVAIGWLYGRSEPSDDKRQVMTLSAEFRNRFREKFGATSCQEILDLLGEQDNRLKCKRLTATTAGILYDILQLEAQCKI